VTVGDQADVCSLVCLQSSVTLVETKFVQNLAEFGGAIYSDSIALTITTVRRGLVRGAPSMLF
jgi:predicted outer membrane repeat protein